MFQLVSAGETTGWYYISLNLRYPYFQILTSLKFWCLLHLTWWESTMSCHVIMGSASSFLVTQSNGSKWTYYHWLLRSDYMQMVDFISPYGRIFKLLVLFKMKGTVSFRIEKISWSHSITDWQTLIINELKHKVWDCMIFYIFVILEILEFWSNLVIFVDQEKGNSWVECFF